ncbi:hypothetical protein BFJ66_g15920 [Fusarium oxysporum f. sp. cepae]|uniref:Uncharacterized protein n=1 Tax=Fusarium oxysporum f. sp. cepae TaxID=396571 RepID=A0A3L6N0K8_FUSOX|nr:hypothetical protein BFJ65_g14839 [Fusarium oxysporum f. sp. cepae]RKK26993.1 hypothetical protein BFJ67_g16360 [Fusarium oxysporum f. sp. cepae]RKK31292.1 hypothetical protein BFJ66_g15920 [Fusarium oxysporum f. sp. cepae]
MPNGETGMHTIGSHGGGRYFLFLALFSLPGHYPQLPNAQTHQRQLKFDMGRTGGDPDRDVTSA